MAAGDDGVRVRERSGRGARRPELGRDAVVHVTPIIVMALDSYGPI